ncbi:Tat pathway signal protein [Leptolyngbya sp. CCNP1308]|uniref:Acg family FMN-binding oxidoreductase n=1 Tax=Leptolyngbya sp. CCNP1308 TaxID=3110255 RepID=UPI002B215E87|nr:Tat pathway signal protein [Leptolyngbya sp. CCNP1308]MEA5451869.1 Tat pathway signal protein [Leptolyngbya sp. CCNP1308]
MTHAQSAQLKELVRYGILAPSSHNTQCWPFHLEEQAISILPDLSRRCPVVDPDGHHLYVSLGCAAENILQAAKAQGLSGQVTFDDMSNGAVRISFTPCEVEATPLFEAIAQRQCSRTEYDGQPLTPEELALLTAAGTGAGVRVVMLTQPDLMKTVLDYVVKGNTAQINNPAFVKELKSWIRFNNSEAEQKGDGLSVSTSGNPSLPRWLGNLIFPLIFKAQPENEKYARQIRSSAGIAVFVSEHDDRAHWIEVGRCYERFALQSTALGIRNALLNQPVEEAGLRPNFAKVLGLETGRPDLVVRFGRGPKMPGSLRRSPEAVLV